MKDFDEIRPYETGEMRQAFEELLDDRQFNAVLKGFAPWLPKFLRKGLLRLAFTGVETPLQFQKRFMKPVVKYIIRKHTDGCTFNDEELRSKGVKESGSQHQTPNTKHQTPNTKHPTPNTQPRYTFLTNHRDIVLDSAFLDVLLIDNGYPTTVEIGIGDNLLIYPWIKRLVRMNKAFIVRRGLTPRAMLESSQLMSRYIHHAVTEKHENIWLAQREGRAKDSDDRTQEAVLKMLAMGANTQHPTPITQHLTPLNIVPLTISYEYDPCDYLKAQEFQQKRDNPSFKKSRQDDLDNMRTGIFGYKGRVHYHCAAPINTWMDELKDLPKNEFYTALAQRIDTELHRNYRLYPINYCAADLLSGKGEFIAHYTEKDRLNVEEYIAQQIAKITLPEKDVPFLRERILTMYANPLKNYLKVKG